MKIRGGKAAFNSGVFPVKVNKNFPQRPFAMNQAHFSIYADPVPAATEDNQALPPLQPLSLYHQASSRLRLRPACVGQGLKSVFVQNQGQHVPPPPKSARPAYKPKNICHRSRDSRSSEKSGLSLGISFDPAMYQQTDQKTSMHPFKQLQEPRDKSEPSRRASTARKTSSAVRSFFKEPLTLGEQLNAQLLGDCGQDIAEYLHTQDPFTLATGSLQKHDISKELRCKMVDWMVEVLTNFKSQDQTLFLAISLLDRYFAVSEIKCTVVDLHLAGIIGMFSASKLEDPLPLTLDLAYNNIGHKRFTQEELRIAQMKILSTLQWKLHVPTIYENILAALEFALPLTTPAPSSFKQERLQLQKFAVYLAMLVLHDYDFVTATEAGRIARACLRTALRLKLARSGKESVLKTLALFSEDQFISELCKKLTDDERKLDDSAARAVEHLYFHFETKFPGINNLRQLCKDVLPEKLGLRRL